MKSLHFLILSLLLTASSLAQTIGTNSFLFHSDNSRKFGYGIGFEYGYSLSKYFDLIAEPAFLYSSNNSALGKLEYIHIPVHAGLRFYPVDFFMKPYISLSGIASYFSNDQISLKEIVPKIPFQYTEYIKSYSKFNYGINLSLGTKVMVTDYWNINLNMTASIISDRYADYSGYKIGVIYNLK